MTLLSPSPLVVEGRGEGATCGAGPLATAAAPLLADLAIPAAPRRIGRLVASDGAMLEATGLDLPIGSGARVIDAAGQPVRAEVVGFRHGRSVLVALEGDVALVAGARVEPDGGGATCAVGPGLLGRVMDALGRPLDGLGPIAARDQWPLAGRRDNPLARGRVTEPFDLGVRAVNALLTAGVGQRVALMAGSGVGKSVLMGQMLSGAEADVVVVGLVGERAREVSDFIETKLPPVRHKAVVVAVPADHPPILRLRAATRATAIAEYFRAAGLRVLLLIDSLTRVAHAQREIGLAAGEPPTVKGYPPSALGLIPRLCERAGVDAQSGGSVTALYTVLADGDDPDDPIVDTARAIVDGHVVLTRALAEQGVFPAIDVGRSLSRVMSDIVAPDHAQAAARLRRLWSVYQENKDLVLMGAYREGSDASLDEAIRRHGEVLGFLRQGQHEHIDLPHSVDALLTGFGG